jgi:CheY-like chemotaxis protein
MNLSEATLTRDPPPAIIHARRRYLSPCACQVEPMAIKALRHGASDYLRKPFDGAEFQSALDRTISYLTLARQHATLRRHLGTEQ